MHFTVSNPLKYFLAVLLLSGLYAFCPAQSWKLDSMTGNYYLNYLSYQDFIGLYQDSDSTFHILTSHRAENYWDKNNQNPSVLLLSTINNKGQITGTKRFSHFAKEPLFKSYKNLYYVLDNDLIFDRKEMYYHFYIFDTGCKAINTFKIPHIIFQDGFRDFVTDEKGSLYLLTIPYYNNRRPKNFTGSYLLKCTPDGKIISQLFFSNSMLYNLEIHNDSLNFTRYRIKMGMGFYYNDSISEIICDSQFNCREAGRKKVYNRNNLYKRTNLILAGGEIAAFIDSSSAESMETVSKIVFFDKNGRRKWEVICDPDWLIRKSTALKNGGFVVQIEKINDYNSLVLFDTSGNRYILKTFSNNKRDNTDYFYMIDYYEMAENEIWLFYNKGWKTGIYLEKIPVNRIQ